MLKNLFLILTVCLLTFFGFYDKASAEAETYVCKANGLGYTSDKISIEFSYDQSAKGNPKNRYINISKQSASNQPPEVWDALYSTDADFNYWTTPVLRDIIIGTNPLVIVQENGITPGYKRLKADFYGKEYPVVCELRQ